MHVIVGAGEVEFVLFWVFKIIPMIYENSILFSESVSGVLFVSG